MIARALLAALLVLAVAAPAASAKPPRGFFGMVSEDVFAGGFDYQRPMLGQQRSVGVSLLRQNFSWKDIEPARGVFDFSMTDRFVLTAAKEGIEVMPLLFGEPAWATSRPPGNFSRPTFPPRRMADFGVFAAAIAMRYGKNGSLWLEHPGVKPRPVRAYQVWNEPNLPIYWGGRPSPKRYAALLRATHRALHAVDPKAMVVTAGLPKSKQGMKLTTYVKRLYAAGARKAIDVLGVNPYAPSLKGIEKQLREARGALPKKARKTPLWITEIGWASGGPPTKGRRVGPKKQAVLVDRVFRNLAKRRKAWRLKGIVYFAWKDAPVYPGGKDFWGLHTGLYELDGRPKPAAVALRKVTRAVR
ncbi:MAG: beta-galactosidase [Solirubrobacteraceae bacterium]|nr:beta-galactosidase [Solirubrobacteraceae bacterium]